MPAPATRRPLVIDARPRGPNGPLAAVRLQGRTVLEHLLHHAERLGPADQPWAVHARVEDHEGLRAALPASPAFSPQVLAGPPPEGAVVLRADRLYDAARLRRAVRLGRDPESAAIWRLDRPAGLQGAEDELARRQSYQPLGRYWALAPARGLARWLAPTVVRPNALTILAGALVLGGAVGVALGCDSLGGRLGIALALALGLVLDTADGHLARLQGTASAFGQWLDANLDEAGDMALHAAIAWAAFARDGHAAWLGLGMLYAMGKYVYLVGVTTGATLDSDAPAATPNRSSDRDQERSARTVGSLGRRGLILLGHADLRWHLWIALAALGRLDLALVAYAAYFPLRAAAGLASKVARRA